MSASPRQPSGPEWVRAWKPVVAGVHEVFHARFVDYAYPPHVHDAWTVFIVDDGWIRYDLETRHRGAGGERVTILPPHVVHDGRAATGGGFRKRVLYVSADVLPERLIGPAVDRPDVRDPALLRAVHALHRALGEPDDALQAEARLALVGDRLRAHLGDPLPEGGSGRRGSSVGPPTEVVGGSRRPLGHHPSRVPAPIPVGWPATCGTCWTSGCSSARPWPRPAASSAPRRPTSCGASPAPSGSRPTST